MSENNKNLHTASGAFKRKLKKLKDESNVKLIKTNKKINSFFKSAPVEGESTSKQIVNDKSDSDNNLVQVPNTSALASVEEPKESIEIEVGKTLNDATPSSSESSQEAQATSVDINLQDPSTWGNLTSESTDFLLRNLAKHFLVIKDCDFSKSKRQYSDKERVVKEHMFFTKLPNGELKKREWLMYSNTTGCLYCVPCKLFHTRNDSSFCKGFNDWKNCNRLKEHEQSAEHRLNTKAFVLRGNVLGKIDSSLHESYLKEVDYWHRVLKRVVDVIKFLGTRGLSFRGTNETFGVLGNGNFMGALELVAEYDDFLKNHIETKGNPGSGKVSYLSKTICDEFIELMYKKIVSVITEELKKSKYYSLSVDSTPDITHSDQLTVILRYVLCDGTPVERFIGFVQLQDHTGAHMEEVVLKTLSELEIPLSDMRGQSYDNATNMSGKYIGLQARIKDHNSLAEYVPCTAHSLNLVGTHAADCCLNATKMFMFVQEIYVFMSASTSRWAVIEDIVQSSSNMKKLLPKRLNITRWAAKWHAVRALLLNYWSYYNAIKKISDDQNETNVTRAEANGICKTFFKLESAILLNLWYDILKRFDASSKTLQNISTDLSTTCQIYKSLMGYVMSLRDDYNSYEEKGKDLSQIDMYVLDEGTKRRPKRKRRPDEAEDNEPLFSGREDLKINTFNVIIDRLHEELRKRSEVYFDLNEKFGFLSCISSISNEEIKKNATVLMEKYNSDLDDDFGDECVQFKSFVEGLFDEYADNDDKNLEIQRNVPLEYLRLIREKRLTATFPNMDTALRILMCIMTSNASGERSFSVLKRVKNYLRNSTSNSRLSSLASFVANADLFKDIDFDDLVKDFAAKKVRKVCV